MSFVSPRLLMHMAVFILEDALSIWANLGKHLLFVWLFVSNIKTGTKKLYALSVWTNYLLLCVVPRQTMEDNSSTRIIHIVPVFILETNNQTNNKCLPKFAQIDNASSSMKTAICVKGLRETKLIVSLGASH